MPFIVVDEGNVVSALMAFLPKMAENQAFEAIFLETIKMSWSANGILDQLKSRGFGTENSGFDMKLDRGETGIAAMVSPCVVAEPCAELRALSAHAAFPVPV